LIVGLVASGVTLGLSLNSLFRDGGGGGGMENNGDDATILDGQQKKQKKLDGHIYSLDGPVDSDGYPLGMRELAEENYAKCLSDAEGNGIEDGTSVCNVNTFFDAAATAAELEGMQKKNDKSDILLGEEVPSSPLRTKINNLLTSTLRMPPSLAIYLTTLQTQTIAYLSSLFTFLLFLTSHYIAHKIHLATMQNDPMKHFVASATDKSVRADGTVAIKKGETEAQRKKRERMLQNERLKSKMGQLAMEAKQRVEERRRRIEGHAAVEKEKEEVQKKAVEEQEEIVKMHGRQYMMIKAGVPEAAILNSFLAEGIDDVAEQQEIIGKLRVIKVRRAEEAQKVRDAEEKKLEDEKKEEEEKERVAKERLRMMKGSKKNSTASLAGSGSVKSFGSVGGTSSLGGGASDWKKKLEERNKKKASDGVGSVASSSTIATTATDPSSAKANMLGQIGGGKSNNLKKSSDPSTAKANMLGQIGGVQSNNLVESSSRKLPTKIPSNPAPRSGSSTIISGNLPTGKKSDRRWDRESKSWVDVEDITPQKSNKKSDNDNGNDAQPVIRKIPSRLKMNEGGMEEEKKGEEESSMAMPLKQEGAAASGVLAATPSTTIAAMAAATPKKPAVMNTPPIIAKPEFLKKRVSELASPNDNGNHADSTNSLSTSTPVLVRISSMPQSSSFDSNPNININTPPPSAWDQRPTARDIQATITAVENVDDDAEVDLAPSWSHSPAFEMSLRNSNSSWDRRPSSRDVMAKIRAVEMLEEEEEEQQMAKRRTPERSGSRGILRRSVQQQQQQQGGAAEDSLAIIDEGRKIDPNATSMFEFRRKSSKNNTGGDAASDDEISELSEPTYVSLENAAFKGRSIPQALFVPQQNASAAALSPMASRASLGLSPSQKRGLATKDNMEKLARMAENGGLDLPYVSTMTSEITEGEAAEAVSNEVEVVVKAVEETEEQKQRRQKAEARAKKMEAISARRNAGMDDDESAVSGISKRHRMRRKKKAQLASIQQEDASVKSDALSSQRSEDKSSVVTPTIKGETEEEKLRKKRAEARARKLEAMAAMRNAGKDDGTVVSGISKRHRIRRKKSALAANAISPEEQRRIDWKQNVYASVMNSERVQWRTAIYAHALNAETTRQNNIQAKHKLDEQNAAAQRRLESKKSLDKRAKKFAARADRFHKIRRDGGGDDDGGASVVSKASRMRRRRGRKSSGMPSVGVQPPLEEMPAPLAVVAAVVPHIMTAEEKEKLEREQWCNQVYITAMHADQTQWKKKVYALVLNAEDERNKRLKLQARIAMEEITSEARKEKEQQNELRAKKMEKIKQIRDAGGGVENVATPVDDDGQSSVVTAATSGSSSMKKMRNRRRKAAMKKASK